MSISSDPNNFRGGYRCTNSSSSYYGNYVPTPLVLVECRCAHGFSGNPYISGGCKDINECLSPDNHRCSGKCVNRPGGFNCVDRKVPAIIGASTGCGAILLFGFSWWFYKFIKKRREIKQKRRLFERNGGVLLQQLLSYDDGNHVEKSKLFTSKELEKATDNFDENRVLGRGGQGTVYKGMLTDGNIVAIKKSKIIDEGKVEEFVNEVIILSQINHRNVVKLLGCCLETEVPLLVYEFIQNGTLYQYLHYPNEEFVVSWDVRLRIATEIAGALSYLHFSAAKPIYHRDIKSSNILLDYKYRAKIADFGTSRMVAIDQTHLTTIVQGTIGYLDPELLQTSQFTDKSDVYSFGVVLIELLTGQKPISSQRADAGRSLTAFFLTSMEDDLLFDIIDAGVLKQGKKEEMAGVANLARRCLNWCGRNRPTMKEVAIELERLRAQHLSPPDDVQQDQQLIKPESIQAWHDMTVMKMSKVETEPSSSEVESLLHITVPR